MLVSSEARSRTSTTHIGLDLVEIPAGEFWMGSRESLEELDAFFPTNEFKRKIDEKIHDPDEWPRHRVRITRPFRLGRTSVTVGQFRQFIEASGYRPESEQDGTGGWGVVAGQTKFAGRDPKFSWQYTGWEQTDAHPVVNVSWADAAAFCEWLSQAEGKRFRLPTEAQWEYACRAGTEGRYFTGDDPESLIGYANIADASGVQRFPDWLPEVLQGDDGFIYTAPVASFAPNAFGLHDMHGNVWEWCRDWYDENFYTNGPTDDPECTIPPGDDPDAHLRVRRGGAWHTAPIYARASFRNYNDPTSRYLNLGFRVVED